MELYQKLPENSYIKKLLIGIDEAFVERLLLTKRNYETTKVKEDKRLYRDKLTSLFWELYPMVAAMISPELSTAKRLFLRYGLFDLRNLSPEDQKFILTLPVEPVDYENETIFYVDEWLQGIVDGKIKPSAGDETENGQVSKSSQNTLEQVGVKEEKHVALLRVEGDRFNKFKSERSAMIHKLADIVGTLKESKKDEETGYEGVYTQEQNNSLDELLVIQKDIKKVNKEISASVRTMKKAQESLDDLEIKSGGKENTTAEKFLSTKNILAEVTNIRQMVKMTVGRQGNSYPFLTSGFIPRETKEFLFKKNVRKKLDQWLTLDPEAFMRTYKGDVMNIMPYMILVPGYGSHGACWEPLDMNNKKFGRGRMTLPIFTRSPDLSLLTGIGDIRWQVAKEISSYYWMEEGLTGRYYEYYLEAKLKGDLKTLFITDYLLWMTKETQGMQKLEQSARYVFWRYVPMPDEYKIRLSKKGYYYNQLWEKEQVWRQNRD